MRVRVCGSCLAPPMGLFPVIPAWREFADRVWWSRIRHGGKNIGLVLCCLARVGAPFACCSWSEAGLAMAEDLVRLMEGSSCATCLMGGEWFAKISYELCSEEIEWHNGEDEGFICHAACVRCLRARTGF